MNNLFKKNSFLAMALFLSSQTIVLPMENLSTQLSTKNQTTESLIPTASIVRQQTAEERLERLKRGARWIQRSVLPNTPPAQIPEYFATFRDQDVFVELLRSYKMNEQADGYKNLPFDARNLLNHHLCSQYTGHFVLSNEPTHIPIREMDVAECDKERYEQQILKMKEEPYDPSPLWKVQIENYKWDKSTTLLPSVHGIITLNDEGGYRDYVPVHNKLIGNPTISGCAGSLILLPDRIHIFAKEPSPDDKDIAIPVLHETLEVVPARTLKNGPELIYSS